MFKKIVLLAGLLSVLPMMAFAQIVEETESVVPATTTPVPGEEISFFSFIMKGGIFIIPIIILLFYAVYVIIERVRYINRMTKYNANLISDLKMTLEKGNISDALAQAQREPSSYGAVMAEGIQSIDRPLAEIERNMDKVTNIEIGKMEKGNEALGIIAGIAPTFGFVGTIAGVIKIFYNISISENVSIGNISGGLYEKMISSGAGLIVGLIAFAAYHILNTMIDRFALKVQIINLDFINIIRRPVK
ncbi:MAG TPA: MotA/TolQ/ExbB proton channel family protein [Crocinitomicaceae bacterium]|nr:MotA/TolQ/ExbB proton channel family protein [Crocinitomicaceae bacterium]